MLRAHARGWVAALVVGTALIVPATADAQAYEPNDSFAQALGPLAGGTDYTAAKDTSNDRDFYYFNTSGQRQFDVSVTALGGCGDSGVPPYFKLLDFDGQELASTTIYNGSGNNTRHILWSAPRASQYVLATHSSVSTGCQYRFRIDPPDAVTSASPGVVVTFGASKGTDDAQRLTVGGQTVSDVAGRGTQTVPLGPLANDARIALDAFNSAGQWSWDFTVTNTVGRARTTVAKEAMAGGSDDTPRIGNVRHLVINAGGTVFENCGESSSLTPCFPYDTDADGISPPADCDDRNAAIKPGAPEIYDNAIDENCDGVANKRQRAASKLTLKRRGATYSGRLTSASAECVASRRVSLLRRGSSRKVASTSTAADGTFKLRRSRRARGRVYVSVTQATRTASVCLSGTSKRVTG